MARASTTAENNSLDGLEARTVTTNVLAFTFLCSADPGTTGANENSTTRQSTAWNAASGGNKTNSGSLSIPTPGTVAETYFGTNSASTAGTYGLGGALTASVTATTVAVAAGGLTLSSS